MKELTFYPLKLINNYYAKIRSYLDEYRMLSKIKPY